MFVSSIKSINIINDDVIFIKKYDEDARVLRLTYHILFCIYNITYEFSYLCYWQCGELEINTSDIARLRPTKNSNAPRVKQNPCNTPHPHILNSIILYTGRVVLCRCIVFLTVSLCQMVFIRVEFYLRGSLLHKLMI